MAIPTERRELTTGTAARPQLRPGGAQRVQGGVVDGVYGRLTGEQLGDDGRGNDGEEGGHQPQGYRLQVEGALDVGCLVAADGVELGLGAGKRSQPRLKRRE